MIPIIIAGLFVGLILYNFTGLVSFTDQFSQTPWVYFLLALGVYLIFFSKKRR